MFDVDDPPKNYKTFFNQVRRTLEDADIELDDDYNTAIFYVTHEGEANIVYAFEVYENAEGAVDGDDILYMVLPSHLKSEGVKYYALVLPAVTREGDDVVMLLSGDVNETQLMQAELNREDDEDYIILEPWEKLDVLDFPELSVPYRRCVVYQG